MGARSTRQLPPADAFLTRPSRSHASRPLAHACVSPSAATPHGRWCWWFQIPLVVRFRDTSLRARTAVLRLSSGSQVLSRLMRGVVRTVSSGSPFRSPVDTSGSPHPSGCKTFLAWISSLPSSTSLSRFGGCSPPSTDYRSSYLPVRRSSTSCCPWTACQLPQPHPVGRLDKRGALPIRPSTLDLLSLPDTPFRLYGP